MSDNQQPAPSPLLEPPTNTLDELFARLPPYDPESVRLIVIELRRQREAWDKAESEGKRRAPSAKKAAPPVPANISLAGLGLDKLE